MTPRERLLHLAHLISHWDRRLAAVSGKPSIAHRRITAERQTLVWAFLGMVERETDPTLIEKAKFYREEKATCGSGNC